MFTFFGHFKAAFGLLFKDKIVFILSTVPIIIGVLIYTFLGSWLYGDVLASGQKWISSSVSSGFLGEMFFYIFAALMTVGLYFLINWTFVLIVSLVACPFNDLISSRVEKIVLGQTLDSGSQGLKKMMGKIWRTIINELKKIGFIILLTLVSLVFSILGFVPVSFIISAILLAVTFLDYCWCRHDLTFGDCLRSYRNSLLLYTSSGIVFLLLMSVPIVNLLMLPYAVVYFSYIFSLKKRA